MNSLFEQGENVASRDWGLEIRDTVEMQCRYGRDTGEMSGWRSITPST
jgi:hypothetical protein